ncbi:hypothetical protein lerEdw1_003790 [Lerista edwardsae]|nr:hypothetical protein lerEdw1_003790 [Lerista edwardsae]
MGSSHFAQPSNTRMFSAQIARWVTLWGFFCASIAQAHPSLPAFRLRFLLPSAVLARPSRWRRSARSSRCVPCGAAGGPSGLPQGSLWLESAGDRVLLTDRGKTVTLYKVLQIWTEDDPNFDRIFKATLSSDVYRIHSLPHTETLVLFKGGAVKRLDALLAEPQQEIENVISNEVIRWSDLFMDVQQPVLMFITEQDGNCFLYVHQSNPCILHKFKFEQRDDSFIPLSFAAYLKDKVVTLLSLYSDGCVYKVLVPLQQSGSEGEQILSESLLIRLAVSNSILKGTSIAILDKDHIAIAGCLDSPNGDVRECISIWNIKFQTLQASKELPHGTSQQCWCYGDKLFVTHGKELKVIFYKCETSSLAAAVGKTKGMQISERKTLSVNWNMLQEDDQSEQSVLVKDDSKKLLRPKRSMGAKSQLESLAVDQLLSIIKDSSQTEIEEKLAKFLSNTRIPDFQTSVGCILSALVNRCKTEPAFYPSNCLVQLIQTQGVSYSMCPGLMAVALEKTDVHLLQLCLQQFPDIPEAITCACLRAFLSLGDERLKETNASSGSVANPDDDAHHSKMETQAKVIQNGFSSEPLEEDGCDTESTQKSHAVDAGDLCPVGPQKATLLYPLQIFRKVRNLFLRYLQYLYMKCNEEATIGFPEIFSVSINQIMDWMCLLLDAHFTVVVMLPEARELLSELHKFVRAQVRLCSELNKIEGSLKELQRLKQSNDGGLYSIEVLKLF